MCLRGAGLQGLPCSLSPDNGSLLLAQDVLLCCFLLKCWFFSKLKVEVL